MIKIKEAGQAFILVLIILAIGAALIIPALRLTNTGLQSSQIISRKNTGLYAAEAAQQKIMWMLFRGTLADNLTSNEPMSFTVDVCGAIVNATIVMRVVESKEGIILAGEDTIMVSKTVSPSYVPSAEYKIPQYIDYEMQFEQVSSNNTASLEAVWDIIPEAFGKQTSLYVPGSSEISIDGGEWQYFPNPAIIVSGNQLLLRWPASGSFDSSFGHFEVAQINRLKFKLYSDFPNNVVICNWAIIDVGDIYTSSGPQAPITVGSPNPPDGCSSGGFFEAYKTSYPRIIPPLVETEVFYTIHIHNMDGATKSVYHIADYLPPGFEYLGPTSNMTDMDPYTANVTKNGIIRQHLYWTTDQLGAGGVSVAAGANVTLTFRALATIGVSGSYYNEVFIQPKNPPGIGIYDAIDPDYDWLSVFAQTYSWNTGTVIVPAFDSETESDGETVQANLSLSPLGVTINSWQVK